MRTAFITGANRGFGRALVQSLLAKGYMVFAATRKLDRVSLQVDNLSWIECDISDDDSLLQTKSQVAEVTPSLTLLVNNAGVNKDTLERGDRDSVSKLGRFDRNALIHMFDVNAVSAMMVIQTFLPLLIQEPSYIVNVGSSRGTYDGVGRGTTANYGYAASKAALHMLTFCAARELPPNVRIFGFNPGRMATGMRPDGENPALRASQCLALMDNWQSEYHGRLVHWDGTLHPC